MHVAGGPAGELVKLRHGVDRQVLPVPVPAADVEVVEFVIGGPVAEQVAFPGKRAV